MNICIISIFFDKLLVKLKIWILYSVRLFWTTSCRTYLILMPFWEHIPTITLYICPYMLWRRLLTGLWPMQIYIVSYTTSYDLKTEDHPLIPFEANSNVVISESRYKLSWAHCITFIQTLNNLYIYETWEIIVVTIF